MINNGTDSLFRIAFEGLEALPPRTEPPSALSLDVQALKKKGVFFFSN